MPNPHHCGAKPSHGLDHQRFIRKTAWLRPYTRWAARFAIATPQWLPPILRYLPLKLSNRILRAYLWVIRK